MLTSYGLAHHNLNEIRDEAMPRCLSTCEMEAGVLARDRRASGNKVRFGHNVVGGRSEGMAIRRQPQH